MINRLSSLGYLGIIVLFFVIGFLMLIPFYLGPNDLSGCGSSPDNNSLNTGCHEADAIVAISGGDTSARAQEAIELYKNGWAPILVFSGAAFDKTGQSNADAMRDTAVAEGVPIKAILVEEESVNTEQNAANSLALIQKRGFQRIILVTAAYHQRRASLEFDKRTEGTPLFIVNHPVPRDDQWSETWYFTPRGWWLAGSELVKVISFYANR